MLLLVILKADCFKEYSGIHEMLQLGLIKADYFKEDFGVDPMLLLVLIKALLVLITAGSSIL